MDLRTIQSARSTYLPGDGRQARRVDGNHLVGSEENVELDR